MKKRNITALILCATGIAMIVLAYALGLGSRMTYAGQIIRDVELKSTTLEGEIRDIEMDLDMFEVSISTSDVDAPVLTYPNSEARELLSWDWDTETGKLTVTQKDRRSLHISLPVIGVNDVKAELKLELPRDTKLHTLGLNLDMGQMKLSDLRTEKTDLRNDMGNVEVTQCDLGQAKLTLNAGRLKADRTILRDGSEASLDMGDFEGSVELLGQIKMELSMGAMDLELIDTEPVSVDLRCDMGRVKYGDQNDGSSYRETHDDAVAELIATCDMGDITIR